LLALPIRLNAGGLGDAELVANARVGGATAMWEWGRRGGRDRSGY
jgi:hypothetical protein